MSTRKQYVDAPEKELKAHVTDGAPEPSPYSEFFDAIERLTDDCVLYGKASLEAQISRARVGRLRELAAAEWRKRQAA